MHSASFSLPGSDGLRLRSYPTGVFSSVLSVQIPIISQLRHERAFGGKWLQCTAFGVVSPSLIPNAVGRGRNAVMCIDVTCRATCALQSILLCFAMQSGCPVVTSGDFCIVLGSKWFRNHLKDHTEHYAKPLLSPMRYGARNSSTIARIQHPALRN